MSVCLSVSLSTYRIYVYVWFCIIRLFVYPSSFASFFHIYIVLPFPVSSCYRLLSLPLTLILPFTIHSFHQISLLFSSSYPFQSILFSFVYLVIFSPPLPLVLLLSLPILSFLYLLLPFVFCCLPPFPSLPPLLYPRLSFLLIFYSFLFSHLFSLLSLPLLFIHSFPCPFSPFFLYFIF